MTGFRNLRSAVPGARPVGRAPGEIYTNWPDLQLGVIDAADAPVDLLPVRFFSAAANYVIGDFVIQAGQLYRAVAASVPGAFVPANWAAVGGSTPSDDPPLANGIADAGVSAAYTRADHVHPSDATKYDAANPAGYQTAAEVDAALPLASTTLPLAGGTADVGTGTTWARADHVHPSAGGGGGLLASLAAPGPPLTVGGVYTSLLPAAAKFTAPPNFFTVGKDLRFKICGTAANSAAGGTFFIEVRIGAAASTTATPVPLSFGPTASLNYTFVLELLVTCRAVGATARMASVGIYNYTGLSGPIILIQPSASTTNSQAPATFNSTIANVIDVFGQFTAGTPPMSMTCNLYTLEALN